MTSPQKNLAEIWTWIDSGDPRTLPPIGKAVLMAEKGGKQASDLMPQLNHRGWYKFRSVKQRDYVCRTFSYTHWRTELMVDFPWPTADKRARRANGNGRTF